MEIKLILEAEKLEQELLEWDGKLREVQEGQKENKAEVEDSLVDTRVAYWEMLSQQGQDLQKSRSVAEEMLMKAY